MNILFRVDALPQTGFGHLIRSLSIAIELKSKYTFQVIFAGSYDKNACKKFDKAGIVYHQNIENKNEESFILNIVKEDSIELVFFDTLIEYKKDFVLNLKENTTTLFFHSLCEGAYYSDITILPSAHHPEKVINNPVWKHNGVSFYHGFRYIPINKELKKYRNFNNKISEKPVISLTTGGSDPRGVMLKLLPLFDLGNFADYTIISLVGESFTFMKELCCLVDSLPDNIFLKTFSYENLKNSDLVISTFGVTSYELIYMGVPFISVSHAENNARGSEILSGRYPVIQDFGLIDNLNIDLFLTAIDKSLRDSHFKLNFLNETQGLMDVEGIDRICEIIKSFKRQHNEK